LKKGLQKSQRQLEGKNQESSESGQERRILRFVKIEQEPTRQFYAIPFPETLVVDRIDFA